MSPLLISALIRIVIAVAEVVTGLPLGVPKK